MCTFITVNLFLSSMESQRKCKRLEGERFWTMCITFNNDSPMVLCPHEKYVNVVLFSKFCESFYPPLAMECILCCVFSCRFWDLRDEAKNTIGPNSHTWLLWWKRTGWTITEKWNSCIQTTHLIPFSQKTMVVCGIHRLHVLKWQWSLANSIVSLCMT